VKGTTGKTSSFYKCSQDVGRQGIRQVHREPETPSKKSTDWKWKYGIRPETYRRMSKQGPKLQRPRGARRIWHYSLWGEKPIEAGVERVNINNGPTEASVYPQGTRTWGLRVPYGQNEMILVNIKGGGNNQWDGRQ